MDVKAGTGTPNDFFNDLQPYIEKSSGTVSISTQAALLFDVFLFAFPHGEMGCKVSYVDGAQSSWFA